MTGGNFRISILFLIGYGNPHPSDDWSRLFTIFFIIVGVYVVFSGISDFFHSHIYWLRKYVCSNDSDTIQEDIHNGDIFRYRRQLIIYCTCLLLWTIIGACVMKYNEDWSWIAAFYFVAETSSVSHSLLFHTSIMITSILCINRLSVMVTWE